MSRIELVQFQGSHFNEKARWALDLKRVPHDRRSLLPGPHVLVMKKLTGGTETPALVDGRTVIAGSTSILEHLERRFPDPALFPEEPDERARALRLVRRWDAEIGPAVRLAAFFEVLDADFVDGTFARGMSAWVRRPYRLAFPLISRVMKARMAITAENAVRAEETTRHALDFVAKEASASGYLVGDRFGLVDLTCAALLTPCVAVAEWGGPEIAGTAKYRAFLAKWADHPGSEWVRETYRRHRRPGCT